MNPGVFVMGGGGGGGGSGAGGGSGSGSGQGAGGAKGGEGAQGDGRGAPAGAEGQAAQACPIDVITGVVYTFPAVDFLLPGPLPVEWVRTYRSSMVHRNAGIGWGWSHAWSWYARVRAGRVLVYDGEGVVIRFGLPGDGERALGPFGRSLRRKGADLILENQSGRTRVFRESSASTFCLAEVRDRNDNVVAVSWNDGRVVGLVDSVGRTVEARRSGSEEQWIASSTDAHGRVSRRTLCTYTYDKRGALVSVADAGGAVMEYTYDEDFLLVSERRPDGLRWHYRYGSGGVARHRRCVETWGDLEGRDVLAELGGPKSVPEGTRGIFHTRFEYGPEPNETRVTDAVGAVHHYRGNDLGLVEQHVDPRGYVASMSYDERGNVVGATDGAGNQEVWRYDAEGHCVAYVDTAGRTTLMERNGAGDITAILDAAGGSWRMRYDERGNLVERVNPVGALTTAAYDQRGQLVGVTGPSGAADKMVHDTHGNLIEVHAATGGVWRYQYEPFGLPVSITAPDGVEWRIQYDARGDIVVAEGPGGQRVERTFDAMHRVVREVHPSGGVSTWTFVADALVERTRPDGTRLRWGFDALERMTWMENGARERLENTYDLDGNLTHQRDFAGIETRMTHDHLGRVVRVERADGGVVALERNAVGAVTAIELPDGSAESYEYDALGHLVAGANDAAAVRFDRDAVGRIVREETVVGDRRFVTERERDPSGRVTRVAYSSGWEVTMGYSATSRPSRIGVSRSDTGTSDALALDHDVLGRALRVRREDAPHAIECERDALGRLTRTRIIRGDRTLVERRYGWAVQSVVESIDDSRGDERRYRLDPVGRPLEVRGLGADEQFRYSPYGTPLPEGQEWELGRGGRLLHLGSMRLVWDQLGRLVRREPAGTRTARGGEAADTRSGVGWSYRYDDKDQLVEIASDDGAVKTELVYDVFGRRLLAKTDAGVTCFFWDDDACVEVRRPGEAPRLSVFGPGGFEPLLESTPQGVWRLAATDHAGTPWFFLGADGTTAELELTAWGRVARAQGDVGHARLAGQHADDVAGLSYQRHRWYAPDLALFLTPDPLGIDGSLTDVGFVPNVTAYIDPLGLIVVLMSDDPGLVDVAKARAAATGQTFTTHSALSAGSLAGEKHVEIVTHGAPGEAELGGKYVSGKELGEKLKGAGFKGDSVHMTTCNAGTRPYMGLGTSVAQQVANTTGANVTAADAGWKRRHEGALVWTYPSGPNAGQQFIAGMTTDASGKSVASTAWGSGGSWKTFAPKK
jgi:RHS repeat-associated protein